MRSTTELLKEELSSRMIARTPCINTSQASATCSRFEGRTPIVPETLETRTFQRPVVISKVETSPTNPFNWACDLRSLIRTRLPGRIPDEHGDMQAAAPLVTTVASSTK